MLESRRIPVPLTLVGPSMPNAFVSCLFAALLLAAGGSATAMGFGPVNPTVMLGQALNLRVPVQLDDGSGLEARCVFAEVTLGDRRLANEQVRTVVDNGSNPNERVVRVTTTVAVDEPVIGVTVSVGCPVRLTRVYTAFAEVPAANLATAPILPARESEPEPVATLPARPSRATALAERAPNVSQGTGAVAPRPRRSAAAAVRGTQAQAPSSARTARTATAAAPAAASRAAAPPVASDKARLLLDPAELTASQMAIVAAAEAQASAAQAAASAAQAAASAAQERLRVVEAGLSKTQRDAQANLDSALQVRQRLADAETASRWIPVLLSLLALLILGAAWLAWRLRRAARERADPWFDEASNLVAGEAQERSRVIESEFDDDLNTTTSRVASLKPESSSRRLPSASAFGMPRTASGPMRTLPGGLPDTLPQTLTPFDSMRGDIPEPPARREVSMDDQIDLEQQADFFLALGQDDEAVDLLLTHLRRTGGTSPMPFLKLLEIHRQRGEREAYDRTRVRFNQRFNAVAPDWDADPAQGRSLEDYPAVISDLQRSWWAPMDALAELESLLFRKGDAAELFDLPAYQEVLFLYQLVRDVQLNDLETPSRAVDVLLPIDDGTSSYGTLVRHVDLPPPSTQGSGQDVTLVLKPELAAAAPDEGGNVDLDLTGNLIELSDDAAAAKRSRDAG